MSAARRCDASALRAERYEPRSGLGGACCRPRAARRTKLRFPSRSVRNLRLRSDSVVAYGSSPRFMGVGVVIAWCVLFRVLAPTSSSPSSLRSFPASRALQIAGYLCSWCLLAPLRVTVVRCRSSPVAALPLVRFGHSQHVAASLTITRSPHRTARYRYAFGAESLRWLASLRSADLRS